MNNQKTINLIKSRFKEAIDHRQTLNKYFDNSTYNSTIEALSNLENKATSCPELRESLAEIKKLQNQANSFRTYTRSEDKESEFGYSTEQIRDENGKITKYTFVINVREKPSVVGTLSREEMQLIYRMYSNYGSRITQRELSRFFPEYSLEDFKRILRAFNITKASSPFAPHVLEETSKEDLLNMQFREKENDFLRSLEAERVRRNESELKKQIEENILLKEKIKEIPNFIKDLDLSNLPIADVKTISNNNSKSLIIWLSDMHIGASVAGTSDYRNPYDKEEVRVRLNKVLVKVINLGTFDKIIVCNLGDSIDGMDNQTCRRDHFLPQNMNNKEQFHTFISCMVEFFSNLIMHKTANDYEYYCVGSSNHGGDFDWAANYSLAQILGTMNVVASVSDNFITSFSCYNQDFILCHGKDDKDMKANLPLTLNDKTITYINNYIQYNKIHGDNITFVKGDLHQSATTYCNFFKYKSVGSLFGSSEWIHKNFGPTPACCDYSIIDTDNNVLDGRIVF